MALMAPIRSVIGQIHHVIDTILYPRVQDWVFLERRDLTRHFDHVMQGSDGTCTDGSGAKGKVLGPYV